MNEILVREEQKVVEIQFNRPDQLNAMNTAMGFELLRAFEEIGSRRDCWVVVLCGTERAFSTGADLKERAGFSDEQWHDQHHLFERMFDALRKMPQPVVAAVSGWAVGGGCEMAMSCDIVVADRTAQFGQPETLRGLMPGSGGTQWLPRRLPRGLAAYMLFSGQSIDATEAHANGLVTFLVDESPVARARDIAQEILLASPTAVRAAKRSMRLGLDHPIDAAIPIELECWYRTVAAGDNQEGARAFNERRLPRYPDPI